MGSFDQDDVRREYEDQREKFRKMSSEERKSGGWLFELVRWVLENYARRVDAEYIRRKYPGAGATNQAKKAVSLASRYAGIVGGLSGAAATALEAATVAAGGLDAIVTVPAMGGLILGDAATTMRIQLRATYDLSVIHGAPLSLDDAEDCLFILMAALGAKGWEFAGEAKIIGPKVISYNVRKLLRTGLRRGIQEIIARVGGTQLARQLTERVLLRVIVPGINIPISAAANYAFTRHFLRLANGHMVRRGAVIQPLLRLVNEAPALPRTAIVKALIVVMEAAQRPDGWDGWQMSALRQTQTFLSLTDENLAELESYWDRSAESVAPELDVPPGRATSALAEFLVVAAALGAPGHDDAHASAIERLCATVPVTGKDIEAHRARLAA